ncbi:MAG: stage II sporulation protein M [Anaerolineales bacterium]|nr:stage II sporulation protein M [Anaerolineales bacterium]
MNLETFLQQRRQSWQRMEDLLRRVSDHPGSLSSAEIDEFGRLYRAASSDLALAQRDFPRQTVTTYLNQLVGRAHAALYREPPLHWRAFRRFYAVTYPQGYRKLFPYTLAAFLLFIIPAAIAYGAVFAVPDRIYVIEGEGAAAMVEEVKQGKLWTEMAPNVRSIASSAIMTNNIRVMFLTFAGGLTAGLLTSWVLISNGLSLGGVFGLLEAYSLRAGLAEFVVAHGFIELSIIFLAGGCGLYMGDGIVRPGLLSRQQALIERTRLSVQLILGSAPLLILAGLIEGFISPSALPWWIKLIIGLASGVLLYFYWFLCGRTAESSPSL